MKPGSTIPTWTPLGASSRWSASVQPARANLLAEYAPEPPLATRPAVLDTFTIALGAELRSSGSSSSVMRTTASKFTSIVRFTFSWPPSAKVARQAAPALLTSRLSRPCCSCTCSSTRRGASGSVRSAATNVAFASSPARACSRSSRRATSTSCAPGSRASRRAVASPMPLDAPVTTATKGVPRS